MFSSKDIVLTFFEDVPLNMKGVQERFKFKCSCGVERTQNLKKGLSNLLQHIKLQHQNWEEVMNEKKKVRIQFSSIRKVTTSSDGWNG